MRGTPGRLIVLVVLLLTCAPAAASRAADAPPAKRVPWTTSRITGSPEPPPPYRLERAYPNLKFASPVDMTTAPGSDRWFVVEQYGKIISFPAGEERRDKGDLFIDLKKDLRGLEKVPDCKGVAAAYALTFHPQFEKNRFCYINYVLDVPLTGPSAPIGSRVSRFTVVQGADGVPRCDPASEVVMLEWLAGGHNGCCLKFGPDGFLYVSTGDGTDPSPPDKFDTGQDLDDLLSCVLRIDVDRESDGRRYAIPPDNPFGKTPGARGEIYAYGLRNPWRMSFDRATGELWLADVGWELWEMVYRGRPGANYGWSVVEGPQPLRTDLEPGPTPIVPPDLALPHSESMSVTGGYVYRGKKLPELVGHYVFGDWETRWVWASKVEADNKLAPYRRIVQTDVRIISFAEDHDGEIFVLGYDDGGIHRLAANESAAAATGKFPRRLSETGLFESVERATPAPGVVPYSVTAAQWYDGAAAERWVAVPGSAAVGSQDGRPAFPKDGVLARTFFLGGGAKDGAGAAPRRPIETQLLHFDGQRWSGYTYRWNGAGTDGALVEAAGASATLTVDDAAAPGGRREVAWQFASRSQCMTCHNSFAEVTLGYSAMQLDRSDQLDRLRAMALFPPPQPNRPDAGRPKMADPHDASADLDRRARSYLHANCAHCHRFGGGGSALIDLRFDLPLKDTKSVDLRPNLGTFDIADARVVAPGDPARSVLLYRMAKTGRGRMPHIGSSLVDRAGLRLVDAWVRALPGAHAATAAAPAPSVPASSATEPEGLLNTTSGALAVALDVERGSLPADVRERVIRAGAASPREAVRDLFERFAPPGQAVARLGANVDAAKLLATPGHSARGRQVFFAGALCSGCHKVGGEGEALGPDLSKVATKYDRRQLLEHVLEPSKLIEPQYLTYVLRTKKGDDHAGLLVEKSAGFVVLRDAQKKDVRVAEADIKRFMPHELSMMPEGLLAGLTMQQGADLLEFLAAQK